MKLVTEEFEGWLISERCLAKMNSMQSDFAVKKAADLRLLEIGQTLKIWREFIECSNASNAFLEAAGVSNPES